MLDIKTVAKFLSVSETYIRRMCDTGRIAAKKIGRDWVILENDITLRQKGKGIIRFTNKKRGRKPLRKVKS